MFLDRLVGGRSHVNTAAEIEAFIRRLRICEIAVLVPQHVALDILCEASEVLRLLLP